MPLPDSSGSGFQGGLFPSQWTSLIAAHISVVGLPCVALMTTFKR